MTKRASNHSADFNPDGTPIVECYLATKGSSLHVTLVVHTDKESKVLFDEAYGEREQATQRYYVVCSTLNLTQRD